jgi:hypothetical protein
MVDVLNPNDYINICTNGKQNNFIISNYVMNLKTNEWKN